MEQEKTVISAKKLVCDTDLLVILIWSEVRYGRCDPWIRETLENCFNQKSLTDIISYAIQRYLGRKIDSEKILITVMNYSLCI